MAHRHELKQWQWEKIKALLPPGKGYGHTGRPTERSDRQMLNGMLWILGTGAPWRDLPSRYGPWQSVYSRFKRWRNTGVFERILDTLGQQRDEEWLMLDGSIVQAHQDACGAAKKKNPTKP